MIGALIGEYERGRRDARAGHLLREREPFYRLGYLDEKERMRATGRLPQGELFQQSRNGGRCEMS